MAGWEGDGSPFGVRLRCLRASAGLTQEELAERAGLTAKGIAAIERGRSRRPQPQTLRALADALAIVGEERARFFGAATGDDILHPGPPPEQDREAIGPCRLLPVTPPTTLLGRAGAVTAVAGLLLDGARLVTLTGPGGVGKTRLAQAVAARVADGFPDGVTFVPLASLADPQLLVPTLAHTLGLRESVSRPQRDALHDWLRGRHLLLVLDNLEHLLLAALEIAGLLAVDTGITILATSRAPLRLQGEQEWAVPPLALPALPAASRPQDATSFAALTAPRPAPHPAHPEDPRRTIAESPAVRLFVERARAVDATFGLTGENAEAVAAICRRLEGLPLALELAAARVRVLSPAALLARLDAALPLLAGGARDLPARQRTMRDTITWSYTLLSPAERSLFRRLAPFVGGWTIEAAGDVWGEGRGPEAAGHPGSDIPAAVASTEDQAGDDPHAVLDLLSGLVEQSLVVRVAGAEGTDARYRMLEPIRQYACEALAGSGEEGDARDRHAAHFLALAERAEPGLFRAEQARWLDRLVAEGDNIRAALDWFLAHGRLDEAVRLGWAVHRAWWVRGHLADWRRWRAAILPRRAALAGATLVRALIAAACLAYAEGDHAGARALADECLPRAREEGDPALLVRALGLAGHASLGLGDTVRARAWLAESLALAEGRGDRWAIGTLCNGLGYAALLEGELARAEHMLTRAEVPLRESGATWNLGMSLCMRAAIASWEEDYRRVDRLARASLAQLAPLRDTWVIAYPLAQLAGVALAQGEAERATRLLGAADALRDAVGVPIFFLSDRTLRERYIAAAQALLGARVFAGAWEAGRAAAIDRMIVEILAEGDDEAVALPGSRTSLPSLSG